jgi:hypothetical protein
VPKSVFSASSDYDARSSPFTGVKRTSIFAVLKSVSDPKRTSGEALNQNDVHHL